MPKYNHIRDITLKEDNNEYKIGVNGSGINKKCDFYINGELKYQGIPFNKGKSIMILGNGCFIKLRDSFGLNRVIRNGKTVLTTKYYVENAYAKAVCDDIGREYLDNVYLIVVSRNGLKGIYSSKRHLVLPIKYSIIDIDEWFNIVIGEKINLDQYVDELKEEMRKCMRKGVYMQIGEYSEEYETIIRRDARVYNDEVDIYDDWRIHYTWNDRFSDYEEENEDYSGVNVPSDWDDYSHDDSLYDALGGEMDAMWNID